MTLPDPHPNWQGDECFMCAGTGRHFVAPPPAFGPQPLFSEYRRTHDSGLRCPVCNGHGRQPSEVIA